MKTGPLILCIVAMLPLALVAFGLLMVLLTGNTFCSELRIGCG